MRGEMASSINERKYNKSDVSQLSSYFIIIDNTLRACQLVQPAQQTGGQWQQNKLSLVLYFSERRSDRGGFPLDDAFRFQFQDYGGREKKEKKEQHEPSKEAHTQKRPTCTPRSRSFPFPPRNSLLVQMLARLAVGCVACYPAAILPLAILCRSMAFLAHLQRLPLLLFRLLSFHS